MKRCYEYLILSLGVPIRNPNWNFTLNTDPDDGLHRTLAELASLGFRIVAVVPDGRCYLYYLEREYNENDGINRELPSDYDYTTNK